MEFIASEYLQDICISASKTLLSLTGGRYFLKYGDEFKAGDNLNGGTLRSVKTLSGGETFLVSLSLALALSGAICAKVPAPHRVFLFGRGLRHLGREIGGHRDGRTRKAQKQAFFHRSDFARRGNETSDRQ